MNTFFKFQTVSGEQVSQSFSLVPINFPTVSSSFVINGDILTSSVSPVTIDLLGNVYKVELNKGAANNWYFSGSNSTASAAIVSGSYSTGSLCSVTFNNLNNGRNYDAGKTISIRPVAKNVGFNDSFILQDTVYYTTDATGSLIVSLVPQIYSVEYHGTYRTEQYNISVPYSASVNVKDILVTSNNVAKIITPKNASLYSYTAEVIDQKIGAITYSGSLSSSFASASISSSYSRNSDTASFVKTAQTASYYGGSVVSASHALNSDTAITSAFATNSTNAVNAQTASLANAISFVPVQSLTASYLQGTASATLFSSQIYPFNIFTQPTKFISTSGSRAFSSSNGAFAPLHMGDAIAIGTDQYNVVRVIDANNVIVDKQTSNYVNVTHSVFYPVGVRNFDINGAHVGNTATNDGSTWIRSGGGGGNSGRIYLVDDLNVSRNDNVWSISTGPTVYGSLNINNQSNINPLGPNVFTIDAQNGNNYEALRIFADGTAKFRFGIVSSSLNGTASWANNATSASWAPVQISSSFASVAGMANSINFVPSVAVSASFASQSLSASFVTASNIRGTVTSASYAKNSDTASVANSISFTPATASFATTSGVANSINFVPSVAVSSSFASQSISSSNALYAKTSFVDDINYGLVAYLPFDEGSGSVIHNYSSVNVDAVKYEISNSITVATSSGWNTNSKRGGYSQLLTGGTNGSASWVEFNNSTIGAGLAQMSFGIWYQSSGSNVGSTGTGRLVTKFVAGTTGEFSYALTNSNLIGVILVNSLNQRLDQNVNTPVLNDNKWHYIAGTYDGATSSVYVDGKLCGATAFTGSLQNSPYKLRVGTFENLGLAPTIGYVDEFKLWGRALTPNEILYLYNDGNFENGVYVDANNLGTISGSLKSLGGFTGSLVGTASFATTAGTANAISFTPATASYSISSSFASKASNSDNATSAAFATNAATAAFANALTFTPSLATSASFAISASRAFTSSFAITSSFAAKAATATTATTATTALGLTDVTDNAGKIGINNTNPLVVLDVNGIIGNSLGATTAYLDVGYGALFDGGSQASVDFNNHLLLDNTGTQAADYSNRILNGTWTGTVTNAVTASTVSARAWSGLTAGAAVTWSAAQTTYEDRRTLTVTGATTMSIQNLYNGWAGSLKILNGNTGSLLKISPTPKVINGSTGSIALTNVSASVDFIGFEYDGATLYAAVGTNFN